MSHDNEFKSLEQMRHYLEQTGGLPFSELLSTEKVTATLASLGVKFRERIFTPVTTLWTFLSQVLSQDQSCRNAVSRLLAWRLSQGLTACSTKGHAYCEARQRLPLQLLQKLACAQASELESQATRIDLWKGRHVKIVDGTTVTMPDTAANQAAYPRRRNQARGVGFPIARIVAIVSLSFGTILGAVMGPMRGKKTGENTLFRLLQWILERGDVLLGDRLFPSYRDIAMLRSCGIDVVARQHATRRTDFRYGRWLSTCDHVVVWTRPKFNSSRFDRAEWEMLPHQMEIRELRYQVEQSGFRSREIIVVTTLMNAKFYPKEDLANLYRERWQCELDLRSIKTSMQMAHLRCKTPEMVEKEVWAHFLAYNLIRQTMAEAAQAHEPVIRPRHLSFKGACQMVNSFAVYFALLPTERDLLRCKLLKAICEHIVGDRPNRVEPRKLKSRPGKYPYMTRPRNEERQRLCA